MLTIIRALAFALVAVLALVTVAPIGLRPTVAGSAHLERAAAYALLGLLLVLAYPRQWGLALSGAVALAGVLEAAQELTATRHAGAVDFGVKAAAALCGGLIAGAVGLALRRSRRTAARLSARDQ